MHLHVGIPTFYPFDSTTGVKGAQKCVFPLSPKPSILDLRKLDSPMWGTITILHGQTN